MEGAEQDTVFLFQHYLEALKYLPQEQIKEIAPNADQFNIAFLASGTPSSDYEHIITYTNAGIGNADGWLIHLKVQPMYKTGDDSYMGRPGDVIHVFYGGNPAVQEWFDFYNNGEMQWDGHQEINLEAFPSVTFRWTTEQVAAVLEDGEILPLYSGMPIWNVFFTDLTGDGLPELCSTLTIGSGVGDNRIIIYDYANGASYSLEDRMEYDYSLSLKDGLLIATKQVYSNDKKGEVVESGYLAYLNNTLQIVPLTPASTESVPSTASVP